MSIAGPRTGPESFYRADARQGAERMFLTLIAFIRMYCFLLRTFPKSVKARRFDRKGMIAERDAIVVPVVGAWARRVVYLARGTVELSGAENVPMDTAVVFIANHQSYLDIPTLLGFIDKPKAFISKIEVLKVPIIATWMRLMQCTFLSRNDMRQSVRAMHEAVETVKRGYSLVIFPEGTRSKGGPIAEFKEGSFKLAIKAGVPVVPVTIDGSWRLLEEKGRVQKGTVRVTVHPAIPTATLSRDELAELPARVQGIVASAMRG